MSKFKVGDNVKVHDLETLLKNAEEVDEMDECKNHYTSARNKRVLGTTVKILSIAKFGRYSYKCQTQFGSTRQFAAFELNLIELDMEKLYSTTN